MIPYEVDPSLHPASPLPEQFGDGFSPPAEAAAKAHVPAPEPELAEVGLGDKSDF